MTSSIRPFDLLWIAALLCYAGVSGCATFSRDGGFDVVAAATRTQLGKDVRWPRSDAERAQSRRQVGELLAHPLSVDDAVQIALLDNPALQATFEELGISEADLVQSGKLPNPRFTLRRASAAGLYNVEETVSFNVLSLLTAGSVHAAEKRRFAQVQSTVLVAVVQLADRTRCAYYTALAARDSLRYMGQVEGAAQASAELARRMRQAGNWNGLDEVRQRGFHEQAMQDLARAQLADETARSDLARLLGIADERPVLLAERLPDLPPSVATLPELEQMAMQNRIDLQIMRAQNDGLARRLKLTKSTRLVNVLELGPTRVQDGPRDYPYETGYEISFEVPVFDTGDARVRRAEAIYAQSVQHLAQAAIDARSDVRKASARYRATYELAARERDDIMPLRESIAQQDLLRYNASLISVFDLLADSRERIAAVNDYIQSVRDFWIAKSNLDTALIADSSR